MDVNNLVIDIPASIGNNFLAVDVKPRYSYVDGLKTDSIKDYCTEVMMVDKKYDKINVVTQNKPFESPDKPIAVRLDNPKISITSYQGNTFVTVKADNIIPNK